MILLYSEPFLDDKKIMMNERLLLKLLLALFSGLIAAELLVVALFGFRLELMLFCFILAVALTGILVVVRLLGQQRPEIDSVSARRAKAKRSEVMRDRLKDYGVDEEFLGATGAAWATEGVRDSRKPEAKPNTKPSAAYDPATIEEAIKSHAEMYGGLRQLHQIMEKIDEAAFGRLVSRAGLGRLSREEVMVKITMMIEEDGRTAGEVVVEDSALEGYSMERESFDEYIHRCMSGGGEDPDCADGFSVELDSAALTKGIGTPPCLLYTSPSPRD